MTPYPSGQPPHNVPTFGFVYDGFPMLDLFYLIQTMIVGGLLPSLLTYPMIYSQEKDKSVL